MKQIFHETIIETKGPGLYDFTNQSHDFVKKNHLPSIKLKDIRL